MINEIDHLQRIVESSNYQEFFKGKLKKSGYSSIADMPEKEKKNFFNMIDSEWKGELDEGTLELEETLMQSIAYIKTKGSKISIIKPVFDSKTRVLVQSIYNELDKGLVGTGVEQLFLRSIYKLIFTLANTTEVPIEDNIFDNPQVELKRAIDGMIKYGKKINLGDLDLGITTKKSLKRVILDFKKLRNSGTVFQLLDRIRIVIEVLIEASQDKLYESKLDSLCEEWRIK